MTDPELIRKKLAYIETCVQDLRRLANPEVLESDLRERRFIEHTLQIAIQAALDVSSHIVSDEKLGEPRTNRDLFGLLVSAGWFDPPLGDTLRKMVGFRNILVHGYEVVDVRILRDILENRLDDLLSFTSAIQGRL